MGLLVVSLAYSLDVWCSRLLLAKADLHVLHLATFLNWLCTSPPCDFGYYCFNYAVGMLPDLLYARIAVGLILFIYKLRGLSCFTAFNIVYMKSTTVSCPVIT